MMEVGQVEDESSNSSTSTEEKGVQVKSPDDLAQFVISGKNTRNS
jgi:hypothetical protein